MNADPRPLIAHVVFRFDIGGLENGVVNLINRLPADRYRHAVVALTEITDFCRRIERDDVQYLALSKPPGQGLWQTGRWCAAFRALSPAIVHTRNIGALEAQLAARLADVPGRVHGEHGWDSADPGGSNWRHRLTRRVFAPLVHQWIALSGQIERYLREAVGVAPGRIRRICNGVDTVLFVPPAAGRREGIAGSPFNDSSLFVVGTVGRLQQVKDQVNLVRAMAHVLNVLPRARARLRLAIIGDGPQRAEIEAAIHALGIAELVWLAGARNDVPAVLRGFDLFALPSRAEGISNTILESMASGLPVVATQVGGNVELVEHGVTGRLVPPADPAALGEALLSYLAEPAAAAAAGRAGRVLCERRFSVDRMVADYAAVYDGVLARQNARRLSAATTAP